MVAPTLGLWIVVLVGPVLKIGAVVGRVCVCVCVLSVFTRLVIMPCDPVVADVDVKAVDADVGLICSPRTLVLRRVDLGADVVTCGVRPSFVGIEAVDDDESKGKDDENDDEGSTFASDPV